MAKKWNYTNSLTQTVGLMKCMACGKPITIITGDDPIETGDYRFRETDEAYLPQHRTCSTDDAGWKSIDKERTDRAAFYARKGKTYAAFVAEFGKPDIADDLEYLDGMLDDRERG